MCLSPCSCKTVQCASYQGRLSSSNFLILKGWTSCKSLQLTLTSDHKQRAIVLSNCILYWQSRNLWLTPQSHATSPFKAEWKATLGVWKRKMGQLQREMALDLFSHDFWLFSMIFGSFSCFFVVSWVECGTARVKEEEEGSRGKCSLVPCSTVAQWHSSGAGAISKWDLCPSIEQRTDLPTLNRA